MINYEIKELFKSLGITETGTVSAEAGNTFISRDISNFSWKKTVSTLDDILKGAKSIIVFLVPYNSGARPYNLSLYATGRDYHKVCAEISKKIRRFSDLSLLIRVGYCRKPSRKNQAEESSF